MIRRSPSVSSPARRNWRRFASNPKILSKKFSRHGILFVVSAPSGAGKTTLVERIRQTPNLFYSVSCTTRPPRACEINVEDYQFLSDTDFRERVEKGDFLEHAQVHGDFYGTLREPVVTNLRSGKDVLIDIDTQGAAAIRNCGDPLVGDALADVFIMPPDLEELRKRLQKETRQGERSKRCSHSAGHEIGGARRDRINRCVQVCRAHEFAGQTRTRSFCRHDTGCD